MTIQTKTVLKSYFQTGRKPTQGEFADLIDSFQQTTDVTAYGATGNGTTDDTVAIQLAINTAIANGYSVSFPSGTYIVSSLTISGSLFVYGLGDTSIIKQKASTTGDMITFTGNAQQLIVRDIVLDGNQSAQAAQSNNKILASTADGASSADAAVLIVENVEFRNAAFAALSMEGDNATGTREILSGRNLRFRNGAESVDNVGTDYIPRDISLADSVEFFLSDLDFDSDSAPTTGRCALVVGQTQTTDIRYTKGFVERASINRRGANVSQGLGAIDLYIWAKDFTLRDININNSAWIALKWKANGSNVTFENISIDTCPTDISPVAGNAATTADAGDGLLMRNIKIANCSYAANYLAVIEAENNAASDYSRNVRIENITFTDCTGSGLVLYNCKDAYVDGVTANGGVIAFSMQNCDGQATIRNIRQFGGSSAAVYIDNNEATFDYVLDGVFVSASTYTLAPVYLKGRNGVARNIFINDADGAIRWAAHTSLCIDGVVGANLATGVTGLTSLGAVTNLTIQNCTLPGNLTTAIAPGTYTNLIYSGNSFSIGQAQGQNLIINPSGAVYQRDVAATADDTYFADCWYVLSQTGTVTPSRLTNPEDGYRNGIRITQSQASAQRFGFAQIIEGQNCVFLRGNQATLRPRIRVSTSQAIRYAIIGWTGTEDSVTSDFVNDWTSSTYTAGNFFTSTSTSVIAVGSSTPSANTWTNLPALTGSVSSSVNNIAVMVWTEGTAAQNFTLDFDFVSLNQNVLPITFEQRSYEEELRRCRRYLPVWASTAAAVQIVAMGQCISTSQVGVVVPFDVPTRIPVTGITLSALSDFSLRDAGGTGSVVTATSFGTASLQSCAFNATGTGTPFTAGHATRLFSIASASAKILFTGAEL